MHASYEGICVEFERKKHWFSYFQIAASTKTLLYD